MTVRASCLIALALLALPAPLAAQACRLSFAIDVTQGVGPTRPGDRLAGTAAFAATGESFRGEGGAVVHMAAGEMTLGPGITGEIWALVTTSGNPVADLVAVHARNVRGMEFAGVAYRGPMTISLYGRPGSLPAPVLPTAQAGWDAMDLRRSFALHAQGYDRLAGDIAALTADCTPPGAVDSGPETTYPARQ
jgi:antitoxin (DNA-binding transcriptional repressor) of toxin-antitoxin stability system